MLANTRATGDFALGGEGVLVMGAGATGLPERVLAEMPTNPDPQTMGYIVPQKPHGRGRKGKSLDAYPR